MKVIQKEKYLKTIIFCLAIIFTFSLISFAYIGSFTRLATDDYCIGWQAKEMGLIEAISYRYHLGHGGGGRYGYSFISILISRLPQIIYPWLTGVVIFLYLLAATLFIHKVIINIFQLDNWGVSIFIAENIILLSFYFAPNLFQVLYWKVGMLNYIFPIVLFLFFLNYQLKTYHKNTKYHFIPIGISFLSAFLIGAFNEALLTVQVVLLIIWGTIEWYLHKNSLRFYKLLAGIVGSGISLLAIYFSPSTRIRQSVFKNANSLNIYQIVSYTFIYTTRYIKNIIINQPLLIGYLILLGLLFTLIVNKNNNKQNNIRLYIAIVSITIFLMLLGPFAAGVIGLGIEIEDRTKMVPLLIIITGTFIIGCILGLSIPSKILKNIKVYIPIILFSFSICVFFNLDAIYQNVSQINSLRIYKQEWDKRDQQIKSSNGARIRVEPLSINNIGGLNQLRHYS